MDEKVMVRWLVGGGLVGAVVAFSMWSGVPKRSVVEALLRAYLAEDRRRLGSGPPALPPRAVQ